MAFFDGFEDNDATDWTQSAGSGTFQAQSGTVIAGSYSAESSSTNSNAVWKSPQSTSEQSDVGLTFKYEGGNTGTNDNITIRLYNGGTRFVAFQFLLDGETTGGGTWDPSITSPRDVRFELDFANNQYDVVLDGTAIVSNQGFSTGVSGVDQVGWGLDTTSSGGSVTAYLDDVQIEFVPAAPSISVTGHTDTTVTLGWSDVDNEDGYRVYQSQDGSSWTQVADIAAGSTSYQATGLLNGEKYWYYVEAYNGAGGAASNQVTQITNLPAPSGVSYSNVGDTTADLSWTPNANNGTLRTEFKHADGSSWVTSTSGLANTATGDTMVDIYNGDIVDARVVAVTPHATAPSASVQFQTTLPDASWGTLDASTQDQLVANWTDTINYGSYRLEYRETGTSTWTSEGTFGEATTSHTITGLLDGEKYDVRLRTETEHVTGNWVVLAEVTKLPAPSGVTASNVTTVAADLSWMDNSDNEDGFKTLKQVQQSGGSFGSKTVTGDVAANTTSATDDTLEPETTYRLSVRAYTEHVTADSGTAQITTDSLGTFDSDQGIRKFDLVDDGEQTGATVRFRALDDVEEITVELSGLHTQTLSRGDFTETLTPDYYEYEASIPATGPGILRARLTRAYDSEADVDAAQREFDWILRADPPVWGLAGIGCRLRSAAPTLTPGQTQRVTTDFAPLGPGYRDSTTRYEAARDFLRAAGAGTVVRYGRDKDGVAWVRESLDSSAPVDTTIIRLRPASAAAVDGLWCVVVGGDVQQPPPVGTPAIQFELVPLAPASDYQSREELDFALGVPVQ